MTTKSHILSYLNDQSEQISASRAIKLSGLNATGYEISANQVVEYIREFLYSFQPPLEVDRLVLSGNNFEEFPSNLALVVNSVKYLDFHSNNFRSITEVGVLPKVELLDLSSNRIGYISPEWLSHMTQLKVLSLKENQLRYLPSALGRLPHLTMIEVADNPLLSPSMDYIKQLQKQTSVDWVHKLKQYLVANAVVLDAKWSEEAPSASKARAAKRMGLILKNDEEDESPSSPRSPVPAVRKRSNTSKELDRLLEKPDSDVQPKSAAYFRRLSTLPESERPPPKPKSVMKFSRKLLFAFSEVHSSVRRFSGFCTDKKVAIKMVQSLYTTKSAIDALVETMEGGDDSSEQVVACLVQCISHVKQMAKVLLESLPQFVDNADVCFIRMLYLSLFGALSEMHNAYRVMAKPPMLSIPDKSVATSSSYDTDDIDERLYRAIDVATAEAMVVFSELTKSISGGASNGVIPAKVKELMTTCVTSMDTTKRLKLKMTTIRNSPSVATKRAFWDDTNQFLKSIVQTFMQVKGIMQDLPIFNEVRASMSNLTKTTKDVTILLESSSYRSISEVTSATATHPPPLASIPSVSTIFQLSSPAVTTPVRTPLVASLGAAAQAIKPVNPDGGPLISPSLFKGNLNPFDALVAERQANE